MLTTPTRPRRTSLITSPTWLPTGWLVEPLHPATRDEAIALLQRVFRWEGLRSPSIALPLSLRMQRFEREIELRGLTRQSPAGKKLYQRTLSWWQRLLLWLYDVESLRYFTVRAEAQGPLVAVAGAYTRRGAPDELWGGWLGVARPWRRQGIARALLGAGLGLARRAGFRAVRLSSSDHPREAAAQELYERHGLTVVARSPWRICGLIPTGTTELVRERRLGGAR